MAKLASKHRTSNICLLTTKNVFDLNEKHFCLPTCKNVLAEYEMFDKFGGGKMSKQGQARVVKTISCHANNAGQFRQVFKVPDSFS